MRPIASTHPLAAIALAVACATGASNAQAAGTWANTLEGIDLNTSIAGFEAYFDSRLNLTWLADTAAIQSTSYAWQYQGAARPLAHYNDSVAWASGLSLGTGQDWRLPTAAEFSDMYFTTLGNTSGHLSQRGPFANLMGYRPNNDWIGAYVWTSTTFGSVIQTFGMDGTGWNTALNNNPNIAWAVHNGRVSALSVSAVPEPGTWALALLGLVPLASRRWRGVGHDAA